MDRLHKKVVLNEGGCCISWWSFAQEYEGTGFGKSGLKLKRGGLLYSNVKGQVSEKGGIKDEQSLINVVFYTGI